MAPKTLTPKSDKLNSLIRERPFAEFENHPPKIRRDDAIIYVEYGTRER